MTFDFQKKILSTQKKITYGSCRGLQRDMSPFSADQLRPRTYMSPNAGGGLELRGSEYSCTQEPKEIWRSDSIFNLWFLGRKKVLPTVYRSNVFLLLYLQKAYSPGYLLCKVPMCSYFCTCRKHIAQDTGFASHSWALISVFIAHPFGSLLI
jgi:hypothetical protein